MFHANTTVTIRHFNAPDTIEPGFSDRVVPAVRARHQLQQYPTDQLSSADVVEFLLPASAAPIHISDQLIHADNTYNILKIIHCYNLRGKLTAFRLQTLP